MATRQERHKPSAFIPDERSLGGAHQILADYSSFFQKRSQEPKVSRDILEARQTAAVPMAQRLSINRAARRAAADVGLAEHVRNVYHLNRRIEEQYTEKERRKNPHDPVMHPAFQKRASNAAKATLHEQMLAWKVRAPAAGQGSGRPSSAPVRRRPQRKGDDIYDGWGLTKSLRNVFPSDGFPLKEQLTVEQLQSSYNVYRKAIMQEVMQQRMYKERDLKQLFRSYVQLAPLRDKALVEQVVADLCVELDVNMPPSSRERPYGTVGADGSIVGRVPIATEHKQRLWTMRDEIRA